MTILHQRLAGINFPRLYPGHADQAEWNEAWVHMLEDSWGVHKGYPFHPRLELARINDGGYAVGVVSAKGVLLAAQAVNRYANTTSWDGNYLWWSCVTTVAPFQRMGLCKSLYARCMRFAYEHDGPRLLVPFENTALVPFLHARGWVESPERWMPNEGNGISLVWELPRKTLKSYIESRDFENDECAHIRYAS